MLILSLVFSIILLLVVNLMALAGSLQLALVAGIGVFAFLFQMIGLEFISWPFVIQAVGIFVVSCIWKSRPRSVRSYFAGTCAVTVAAYMLLVASIVIPREHEYARFREQYPMEDMTRRVPKPPSRVAHFASPDSGKLIEVFDEDLMNMVRRRMLVELHENSTNMFINSPGFGVARTLSFTPTEDGLRLADVDVVPQAGPRMASAGTDYPEHPAISLAFRDLHRQSFADFVNPKGWGYVKDRKHVAGFVPHRMSQSPGGADDWSLQTLDLVGLLMHDKPVAYVSEHLPRMDQLKTAPTRDLDPFETAGLDALRKGEDLYARQNASTLRLLGAIRAVDQCTTCHACDRGELLGAFSYTLGRAQP